MAWKRNIWTLLHEIEKKKKKNKINFYLFILKNRVKVSKLGKKRCVQPTNVDFCFTRCVKYFYTCKAQCKKYNLFYIIHFDKLEA